MRIYLFILYIHIILFVMHDYRKSHRKSGDLSLIGWLVFFFSCFNVEKKIIDLLFIPTG
nr:MAG TPA: hypothetical protein [Caudoviricetes sp.]